MSSKQEQILKETSEKTQCGFAQGTIGSANDFGAAQVAEPSLRERIHNQRHWAQVESRRAEQLMELEFLLDKNPETARILELLEQVKY